MTLRLVHDDPTDELGDVHVIFEPERTHVVLTGRIDLALGAQLRVVVRDVVRAARPVTVDLHHVAFIDTSGLSFLLALADRTSSRVTLLDCSPAASRLVLGMPAASERFDLAVRTGGGGSVPLPLPTAAPDRA